MPIRLTGIKIEKMATYTKEELERAAMRSMLGAEKLRLLMVELGRIKQEDSAKSTQPKPKTKAGED
jgi:hypothetical protein